PRPRPAGRAPRRFAALARPDAAGNVWPCSARVSQCAEIPACATILAVARRPSREAAQGRDARSRIRRAVATCGFALDAPQRGDYYKTKSKEPNISMASKERRMARPRASELTERELEIMHLFWDRGEQTAAAARDELARSGRDLAYTT